MASEVAQDFVDAPPGETWQFTRGALEQHMLSVCLGNKAARLPSSLVPRPAPPSVRPHDVGYLENNLLMSHADAEHVLAKHHGSLEEAVRELLLLV